MPLTWANPAYTYRVKNNFYEPKTLGFSIRLYRQGRFCATRGGGPPKENCITKSSIHDTVAEAKLWLDSLPERPTIEMTSNFRSTKHLY
jgi:hypothetical protein